MLCHQAVGKVADNQPAGLITSGSNRLGYSKNNRNKRSYSKGPKPDDVCNYCKEKGH